MMTGNEAVAMAEPRHFLLALYFAFGFAFLRSFLDQYVFKRISCWILNIRINSVKDEDGRHSKAIKSSESMWKLTYYVIVQVWVLSILYHEPWSREIKQYFKGWPNQELKFSVKIFYMWQCGFYAYSIAALLTWETRRKDFAIMMSHHIVTTILIGFSYFFGFFRTGCVVLALHDTSDVFLEAAKVFKYLEREIGASVCFGLFALSWVVLRLIFFPFLILKLSSFESVEDLMKSGKFTFMYYSLNTMLLTLLIFHVYWWCLISSMIIRQFKNRGKVGEDVRSDSEGDD